MTKPVLNLSAAWIVSLPPAQRRKVLDEIRPGEFARLLQDWQFWARDEQCPPPGAWRIWLFLGGRGAGKTRAGAEWIAQGIRARRMRRIALIAATHADARSVMIEGVAGLLGVCEGARFEPSNARVLWPDGAVAHVLSAEEPDSIRGHQFDAAWCDETDLLKLQMQAKAEETEHEVDLAAASGAWSGLTASLQAEAAIGATYPWVNAVRALVRPALTLGLAAFLCAVFFALAPGDLDRAYVANSLVFAAVTAIVWWFGDRAPKRDAK